MFPSSNLTIHPHLISSQSMIQLTNPLYSVKDILDFQHCTDHLEYLVDWESYGPEVRNWVPIDDILHPNQLAPCSMLHTLNTQHRGFCHSFTRLHPHTTFTIRGVLTSLTSFQSPHSSPALYKHILLSSSLSGLQCGQWLNDPTILTCSYESPFINLLCLPCVL